MSVIQASALPPAASNSPAAVYTVPSSLGCGSAVLAATTTLAPSRAALSPIALPMPRLAPVMNRVLPLRVAMAVARFGKDLDWDSVPQTEARRHSNPPARGAAITARILAPPGQIPASAARANPEIRARRTVGLGDRQQLAARR